MRLYVMRHGPAEDHASSGRDFDRQLTPTGRAIVARVACALQAERAAEPSSPSPLRILSSPRARARETAVIVREAIVPIPDDIEIREALGGETAIPLSLIAAAVESGIDTMLVGHQPVVEELVQQLLGATRTRAGFSTATILGLDRSPDGSGWTLATHLDPSKVPG